MKRRLISIAVLVIALATQAIAVGTVTVTTASVRDSSTRYARYTVAWTSDASGNVNGNAFTVSPGRLVSIRFIPGSGGTQPTDLYDVTLTDGTVTDLLAGAGANLSNASGAIFQFDPPMFQDGSRTFDVVVANAGNAKTGTVVILVQNQ